ncbi:MAG: hypothetical protein J0L87_11470 [Bacteroidetes bacterium]|nr:hypothetical protein [Bacteroidota bacterium]
MLKTGVLLLGVVLLSSCSIYNPFYRYKINYKEVNSIVIEHKKDSLNLRLITQRDSIKTIVKKYLNKNHYELVIKPRGEYELVFKMNDNTVKYLSAGTNCIITEKGPFITKKNIVAYLNASR